MACPIGNVGDITLRALEVLKTVDIIAAEDTRRTRRLLTELGIAADDRLISCHEHNERQRVENLLDRIGQGNAVALMTDAGTPSISDPGFPVVKAAIERGITVVPIPGVSAAITALSASGLATDSFLFAGFLPKKGGKRRERLQALAREPATLIFYESPHRIADFVRELIKEMGDRDGVVAREMTKPYEEFIRGRLSEIAEILKQKDAIKGEITVIVAGTAAAGDPQAPELTEADIKAALEASSDSPSELARQLAAQYGLPRRRIYDAILKLKQKD